MEFTLSGSNFDNPHNYIFPLIWIICQILSQQLFDHFIFLPVSTFIQISNQMFIFTILFYLQTDPVYLFFPFARVRFIIYKVYGRGI